jgi:hypothetical protein
MRMFAAQPRLHNPGIQEAAEQVLLHLRVCDVFHLLLEHLLIVQLSPTSCTVFGQPAGALVLADQR